jgi:hypothetical protein
MTENQAESALDKAGEKWAKELGHAADDLSLATERLRLDFTKASAVAVQRGYVACGGSNRSRGWWFDASS